MFHESYRFYKCFMKAIIFTNFGISGVLEELEVPVPEDILFRSGAILQSPMTDKFRAQLQFPFVIGNEVAGIV